MVHGAFSGGWSFDKFRIFFESRGYRCIAPDLRHHDRPSHRPPALELGRTSLLDYLKDLEALIATLDTEPILIGHSMGGLLCQMLAANGHGEKLILLAPSPPAGIIPSSTLELLTAFGVFVSGMGWGQTLAPEHDAAVSHALSHLPPPLQKQIFARLVPESGYAMFEIMCWMLDPLQASHVDARKLNCPVLALAGAHDPINTPATVRQIAQRYGKHAEYHNFPGVSHWLLDGPHWQAIAQHCATWMERDATAQRQSAP